MKGAAYIRVSTEDQTEFSPSAQLKALQEYCTKNKIELDEQHVFIDEGLSARTSNRPEFQRMIKTAKKKPKPFDIILVHKFDRFARNREDSVVYKALLRRDCGIKVVSITEQLEDDKFSVILEAMLEAMAEYYSLNLSEEVKKGQAEKASRGGFQTRPPFGYEIEAPGNPPKVVPGDAEIVKVIFNKFVKEQWSYYRIALYLNDELNVRINSSRFQTVRVKYILANPFYYGMVRWNRRDHVNNVIRDEEDWIEVPGKHEAIINEELFFKAQARIKQIKAKVKQRPVEGLAHVLSGLMRCGTCGGSMSYGYRKQGSRFRCDFYQKGKCTKSNTISVPKLENAVYDQIKKDAESSGKLTVQTNTVVDTKEIEILERQLGKIAEKYARIKEAYSAGVDTLEEYKENKERIAKEERQLITLAKEVKAKTEDNNKVDVFKEKLSSVHDIITGDLPDDDKRRAMRSVIKEIQFDRESTTEATLKIVYGWTGY